MITAASRARDPWYWMTSWGSTAAEVEAAMPGDEIVGAARYRSTHAVGIDAPAEAVWPWLAQLGQGRGGLYSYDWLENLVGCRMHSLDRIDPALQRLAVGDTVRLVPQDMQPPLRYTVARVEPPHLLLLAPDRHRDQAFAAHLSYSCWTFAVTPLGPHRCRLVVRFQNDFPPRLWANLVYRWLLAPIHLVMERKMLLGIKARAEASP